MTVNGTIKPNEHTWASSANLLFIDQPANTGFSRSSSSPWTIKYASVVFDRFMHAFLNQFGLLGANIIIAGESFAGIYIPYFAAHLTEKTALKVTGIAIGKKTSLYDYSPKFSTKEMAGYHRKSSTLLNRALSKIGVSYQMPLTFRSWKPNQSDVQICFFPKRITFM